MNAAARTTFDPKELTVAIFAGRSGPPAQQGGLNKNFFALRGRPVVQYQLDLVSKLGFRRILLVTETSRLHELQLPERTEVLESAPRQWENFLHVKQAGFTPDERCLVLFGDTPLLTAGAITDFLARCREAPADVHHGLVPHVFVEPFMDFFPRDHTGRSPFHAREFTARLGCLSLARPFAFDPEATRSRVDAVMRGRKQDPGRGGLPAVIVKGARVMWGGLRFVGPMGAWMGASAIVAHWFHERGFPAAADFCRKPVTLARLDDVMSRMVGCPARLVPCPFGGTSLDIDGDADLRVHEQYFDHALALQRLQERIAEKLVEPGFDLSWEQLAAIDRFDREMAAELRRHPEIYLEQRRILLAFPHENRLKAA